MFQTVGHNMIEAIASCIGVPLVRQDLIGSAVQKTLEYDNHECASNSDEVEDLFALLLRVKVLTQLCFVDSRVCECVSVNV